MTHLIILSFCLRKFYEKNIFLLFCISTVAYSQKQDTLFIAYNSKFIQKIKYESDKIWFTLKDENQGSEWVAFEEKKHIKLNPRKITCFESLLKDADAITYINEQKSRFEIDHWKLDVYLGKYAHIFLIKEDICIQVSPIYAVMD